MNTTTAALYAPHFPTPLDHADRIDDLYRANGITPPDRTREVQRLMQAQPDAHTVAQTLAQEALHTTDPEAFIADALERMRAAQAADALRDVFGRTFDGALVESLPARIDEAAADLKPAFGKLTSAFVKAARALPTSNPLDRDAAIDGDHTREYKTVVQGLQTLATFAALHPSPTGTGTVTAAPPALGSVLPIVTMPAAVVELRDKGRGALGVIETLNRDELAGTRTIRSLALALQRDPDEALINVARGKYEGVTFELATNADLTERGERADTAHTIQSAYHSRRRIL